MKLKQAEIIAGYWIDQMSEFCERIEIGGSIRRREKEVGDIEIVCVPKIEERQNLFGETIEAFVPLIGFLNGREYEGGIEQVLRGGRQRKFILANGGVKVDLFMVRPPAQWGVIFAIRTGPSEFSKWIVTRRREGGALPDSAAVRDGVVYDGVSFSSSGTAIEMPEEKDFLEFLEIDQIYSDPKKRRAKWGLFRQNKPRPGKDGVK